MDREGRGRSWYSNPGYFMYHETLQSLKSVIYRYRLSLINGLKCMVKRDLDSGLSRASQVGETEKRKAEWDFGSFLQLVKFYL